MAITPARVVLSSGFSRRYTGGVTEFVIEAKNLRGIIREMDRMFPGLGETLQEETTVAIDGAIHELLPLGAEDAARCEPIYEELPGWRESTVGLSAYEGLPTQARAYLDRLRSVCGVPVDMISTGADRNETIVLRHPFH